VVSTAWKSALVSIQVDVHSHTD